MRLAFLDDNPAPSLSSRPPGLVYGLRAFGFVAMMVILVSVATTEPYPALDGKGLLISAALALTAVGVALSVHRRVLARGQRFAGLLCVAVASCLFAGLQPESAGYACIYFVVVIAGLRLQPMPGLVLSGATTVAVCVLLALVHDHPGVSVSGLLFSVLPWFLVTRLIRRLAERNAAAEELVEELRESRAAAAQAAALAERGRVARDMHDVLAHSLSALALQLEGARLLARGHDADPEVVAAIERAHRLAAGGLGEARQAIAALRGDALPGPERLQDLADAFAEQSRATCTLRVTGTPRRQPSEAGLALYRTAQEALTNIRKHSAADRVEITLDYGDDGTTLAVADHGPGAPVTVGSGGGYGLTGMRERAELLGGRLAAAPTADGYEVRLWLPT